MSAPVRAVLADLDDTLFDHRHATRAALAELARQEPALGVWPAGELERRHADVLEDLHTEVLAGRRTIDDARRERFTRLLVAAGASDASRRAVDAAGVYRSAYERAWQAVPGAVELLAAIGGRAVPVVIVTNNGVAEQRRKLARVGLDRHIRELVTSEEVGAWKPARQIFDHALGLAGLTPAEAVMLGDSWASDVAGARDVGMRAVWFNRLGLTSPDPEVPEIGSLEPVEAALRVLLGDGAS